MAKNRSTRAHARKSAPIAVNSDQAEQILIDARRDQMLAEADTIIAQDEPEVADKVLDAIGPVADVSSDGLADAEAVENNPDVVDSERDLRPTENLTPVIEPEASEPEPTPAPSEPEAPQSIETPEGRLMPSIYSTTTEAYAAANNMRLGGRVNYIPVEGGFQILVRKPGGSSKPVQATEGAVQAPARAQPKVRTPRAKASGPRPDTRNAVIWSMLTRPEGTTLKEVTAAMDAFEIARGRTNQFPTGIGSDAKLFAGRFGYDWRKEADGDATRYFCFKREESASEASAEEVESEVSDASEVEDADAAESAAS
jgi:hypothetical protein